MADEKSTIGLELSLDGSKLIASLNAACTKVKNRMEKSFNAAGKSATKAIETSNEEIKAILDDTERSAKSKAASIAAIYRKQGDSQQEALKKAWSHIERDSASASKKVKKHILGLGSTSKKTAKGLQTDFGGSFSKISGMAKKIGAVIASAFAVKQLVSFGKACINLGSDLTEVENVVSVTFETMSDKVNRFAQNADAAYGLSETMAKRYVGTFGAMADAFGFTEKQALTMSTTLAGLSGDVASFYNITQDEAFTKLKSVFTGETETLKDLGVVMTQSALDAYALANGFGKTTSAMSEAEKVALRYQFVQDKLANAQGDFSRTSGQWANQVRLLTLRFESLKANIGQGLINVLTPVLQVINQLLARLLTLGNAFRSFTEMLTGKGGEDTSAGIAATAKAAGELDASTSGAASSAAKAVKEMRALAGFDEINTLSESDSGTNAGSGYSGDISGIDIDLGTVAEGETVVGRLGQKFTDVFNRITELCEPAKNALKNLWDDGLSRLGQFSGNALTSFYNRFLSPVGQWVLGEGFPSFVDITNNGLANIDFGKINSALDELWDKLTPFSETVGEGLLWFYENVLASFIGWTADNAVPLFLDTMAASIDVLSSVIEALQPLVKWLWDELLKPIAEWTGGLFVDIWTKINDALSIFADWCRENPGVIEFIATVVASVAAAFGLVNIALGIWSVVSGIAAAAATVLGAAFAFLTSPIGLVIAAIAAVIAIGIALYKNWDEIKAFAITTFNKIKDVIVGALTSLGNKWDVFWNATKTTLTTMLADGRKKISDTMTAIKNWISTSLNSIKSTWNRIWTSMKDTISGVFTGIWNIVKGVINSILGGIESMANGVVDGVNTMIAALNSLRFTVPDWVPALGGKSFGFNLSMLGGVSLPRLAQGGFVEKNTPQLAIIGDNRHQGEIVAPEDKMAEMAMIAARMALAEVGNNGDQRQQAVLFERILDILEDILDAVRKGKIIRLDERAFLETMENRKNRNGYQF